MYDIEFENALELILITFSRFHTHIHTVLASNYY